MNDITLLIDTILAEEVNMKDWTERKGIGCFCTRNELEDFIETFPFTKNKMYIFTYNKVENGQKRKVREIVGWGNKLQIKRALRKAQGLAPD